MKLKEVKNLKTCWHSFIFLVAVINGNIKNMSLLEHLFLFSQPNLNKIYTKPHKIFVLLQQTRNSENK